MFTKKKRIFRLGDLQIKPKHLMTDAERVQEFQRKLYRKAKQDSKFCFYVLYDKVRLPPGQPHEVEAKN